MEQCWVLQGDGRCRISPKEPQAALGGVADWMDPWGPPQPGRAMGCWELCVTSLCRGARGEPPWG